MVLEFFKIRSLTTAVLLSSTILGGCSATTAMNEAETPKTAVQLIEPEQAEQQARQALESADMAFQAKYYSEAETLYHNALKLQPGNVKARYGIAELYLATNRASQSISVYSGLFVDENFSAKAWQGSGLAYLAVRDLEQARTQLLKAVELDKTQWRAWNGLGIVHDASHEFAEAEAAYLTAISIHPNSSVAYNNLGMSYMTQKLYAKAEKQFVTALKLNPELYIAETNLRFSLAWQGEYLHALSGMKEEHWAEALNNIGYIALQRADLVTAEAYFARAIELSPSYFKAAHKNLRILHEQYPEYKKGGEGGLFAAARKEKS
ncbi:tetratricopeptide repeat protein [uncultured Sneathiella sp.]|uniref:tetratricopeptide repeat protein n=1 Tax=uncultured Sneathiella sp. TaxID=879315 RepID=UPI002596CD5D|nr:tetratricopeptide repeat protein [uncultured Sneathiella sp.]